MSLEIIFGVALCVLIMASIGGAIFKRVPRRLKNNYFSSKWKELQGYCKDQETWPWAVTEADRLLNEALKKRRFKGKTMGERLVDAQRKLSNNDAVWYAHNLKKKIADDDTLKLKKDDVKRALLGIRQALKDLGAFDEDNVEVDKQKL